MNWNNLIAVLEEYNQFLEEAAKSGLPPRYELRNKIRFDLESNSYLFEIEFNAPEYWKYVNYGRKPGKMPPVKTIESWITKNRIVPRPLNNKLPTTKQLAYLIAKKIGKKGLPGNNFLGIALDKNRDYWLSRVSIAISQDINQELNLIFNL